MSSKSLSEISKMLFQTGGINIFDLRVSLSRYVQLKSCFFDEKISVVEYETLVSREGIKN